MKIDNRLLPDHNFVLAVPSSLKSYNVVYVKVMTEATMSAPERELILTVKAGEAFDTTTYKFNAFTFEGQDDQALSAVHKEFFIGTKHLESTGLYATVFDCIQAQPAVEGKRQLVPVWAMEQDIGARRLTHNVTRKVFGISLNPISSPVIDLISDEAWAAAQNLAEHRGGTSFADFRAKVIEGRFIPKCPELSARSLKLLYGDEQNMPVELVLANRKYR